YITCLLLVKPGKKVARRGFRSQTISTPRGTNCTRSTSLSPGTRHRSKPKDVDAPIRAGENHSLHMIRLENVTKEYDLPPGQPGQLVAADHLTMDVAAGEVFGLVGPNGAGKTTTLKMICGLMLPTAG